MEHLKVLDFFTRYWDKFAHDWAVCSCDTDFFVAHSFTGNLLRGKLVSATRDLWNFVAWRKLESETSILKIIVYESVKMQGKF